MNWHKITRDYKYSQRHVVAKVVNTAYSYRWDIRSADYYDDAVKLGIAGYTHYAIVDKLPDEISPIDLLLTDGTPAKTNEEKSINIKINLEIKS